LTGQQAVKPHSFHVCTEDVMLSGEVCLKIVFAGSVLGLMT